MDTNKDDVINDAEWLTFYEHFMEDFQKYDVDKNWSLTKEEMHTVIEESKKFDNIRNELKT